MSTCDLTEFSTSFQEYEIQTVNHETGEELLKIRDENANPGQHVVNNKLELYQYRCVLEISSVSRWYNDTIFLKFQIFTSL